MSTEFPRFRHHPALDGIRGVAVILVIAFHTWSAAAPGGLIGVDLFFVLSGFLITTLLLEERRLTGRISLARFYTRRVLRLMPALMLLLLGCVVVAALASNTTLGGSTLRAVPFTLGYVANWAYASGADLGALAHTWSLSVEEQFYLLWPLLLIALLRWGGPRAALAACFWGVLLVFAVRGLMVASGASWLTVYGGSETRADALLAGCTLALAAHLGLLRRIPAAVVAAAGVAGLAVLAWVVRQEDPYGWLVHGGFTAVAVCCALLLAALAVRPWAPLVRVFGFRPLTRLGKVSYGVYLWHFPLVLVIYPEIASRRPWSFVVITALAYTLASLSYALVEAPFLRLKRRIGGDGTAAAPLELRSPAGAGARAAEG
ncbi:MAG TPA: acyltransferase [Candidatus Dormibacteraeota bacterium]|jgi:peptidoglycan/LPS O-acetylase OafA/YrhL